MRRQSTAGRAGERRFQAKNRPPEGEPFFWLTLEMLSSPAMQVMTLPARKVLDVVVIEHMQHGGTQNGALPVTYDNFAAAGIRRQSIPAAIDTAVELGWIDLVRTGGRSYGPARRPSEYGLTWLPRCDNTPASNRWKAIRTREQAASIVNRITTPGRTAEAGRRRQRAGEKGVPPPKILKGVPVSHLGNGVCPPEEAPVGNRRPSTGFALRA